jgi:hypothetical protein
MSVRVTHPDRRAFFTPKSLAAYLALSERTVREMLRRGALPSYGSEAPAASTRRT